LAAAKACKRVWLLVGPILGGRVTGAGVTMLESVCTGRSYIPVLMYLLKRNPTDVSSWTMLITYNLLIA